MIARDLRAYSLGALRVVARWHELEIEDRVDRDALAQRLGERFSAREAVLGALAKLGPLHRLTLERVQLRGGLVSAQALRIELLRGGHLDESPGGRYSRYVGSPDRGDSRHLEDVVARLTVLGLLLTREPIGSSPAGFELGQLGRQVFIPDEVLRHLPPVHPPGPPVEVPRGREADAAAFRRDAFLYWSYARRSAVQVIARGTVAKRHFVRIAQSLLVPEEADSAQAEEELGRTYFLRRLLEDVGVLQVAGGRLRPGPRAADFFALNDAEQTRRLYAAWLGSRRWNELGRLPELQDSVPEDYPTPPVLAGARKLVAQLLAEAPAERWIGLEELIAQIRRDHYGFLIPRGGKGQRAGNPYSSHSYNPLGLTLYSHVVPDDATGWELIEAELVVQVIAGALHWLGLVTLGYDDRAWLVALRLTDLGRRLIRGEPVRPESVDGKPLVVQANFQVFAYQHTPTSLLAALESCAERVRVGPVFEYRVTRDSIYQARREGVVVGRIVDLLETHSATPLPQNVRQSLLDWEREQERIVIRRGVSLLHAADPALLDALRVAPELEGAFGRRLTPDVLEVRPETDTFGLVDALTARSQLISVGWPDEPARPTLAIEAGGRIDFAGKLPSIYLWRRLAAFAEPRDGELWVTPAGLRRAADSGLTADEILAMLRAHGRAPLPREVEEVVTAGTRRWGEVALASVALVQVEDREILEQLLAEPSLRGLLRRVQGQPTLAVARPEDVERVRDALASLRIKPSDRLR